MKLRYVASDKLEFNFGVNTERFNLQDSPELTVAVTNPYPNPSGLIDVYNQAIEKQFGVRYDDRFLPPASEPPFELLLLLPSAAPGNGEGLRRRVPD